MNARNARTILILLAVAALAGCSGGSDDVMAPDSSSMTGNWEGTATPRAGGGYELRFDVTEDPNLEPRYANIRGEFGLRSPGSRRERRAAVSGRRVMDNDISLIMTNARFDTCQWVLDVVQQGDRLFGTYTGAANCPEDIGTIEMARIR